MMYNRETEEELPIFEFPVTIEDEAKPRLDKRLHSSLLLAKKIAREGGLLNVLIHTDTIAYKYAYESELIDSLKSNAWFGTINEFGTWWQKRNAISFWVESNNNNKTLKIDSKELINDIGFSIPKNWIYKGNDSNISVIGQSVLIHHLDHTISINFSLVK